MTRFCRFSRLSLLQPHRPLCCSLSRTPCSRTKLLPSLFHPPETFSAQVSSTGWLPLVSRSLLKCHRLGEPFLPSVSNITFPPTSMAVTRTILASASHSSLYGFLFEFKYLIRNIISWLKFKDNIRDMHGKSSSCPLSHSLGMVAL